MVDLPAQAEPDPPGVHLVLYDGVCGLCNRLLQFLLRHDRRGVFVFAPLQSATGRAVVDRWGGDPEALTSFYICADFRGPGPRVFMRSDAALFVAGQLGWPWRVMTAMRLLPKPLRNRIYNVVARNRYRVFGRLDHCLPPEPRFRSRFIDTEEL